MHYGRDFEYTAYYVNYNKQNNPKKYITYKYYLETK